MLGASFKEYKQYSYLKILFLKNKTQNVHLYYNVWLLIIELLVWEIRNTTVYCTVLGVSQ